MLVRRSTPEGRAPEGLLALALVVALASGCEAIGDAPRRIVLVVIDTLRADALPFHGAPAETAPFLSSLAERSLVFERAFATSSWTAPSTASIFTSRYPSQHGVHHCLQLNRRENRPRFDAKGAPRSIEIRRLPESLETVPTFLRSRGYATLGVSANPNVGPILGFDRGFDRFENFAYERGRTAAEMAEWLVSRKDEFLGADKAFLYIHFMDPHPPFARHPQWVPADAPRPVKRRADRAAYHSEVRFTDEALRRVFEEFGLPGDAVVIVTSDHGQEFHDHGSLGHGFQLYNELTRVPLLIHLPGPGAPVGRESRNVSNLDILPTLRALLGEPPAAGDAGVSLLEPGPGNERELFAMRAGDRESHARKLSVLRGRFKLIVTEPADTAELYDIIADPGELEDQASSQPARVRELRALLEAHASPRPADSHPEPYQLSSEEAALLEELGYVETAPPGTGRP